MKIYFISGLGADERAFQKLVLPESWNIIHLNWIEAQNNDTLESYVIRFSKLIDTSEPFAFVGLSFGGIVSIELNKIIKPTKTIIISSITTKYELPLQYQLIATLNLHKLVPAFMLNQVYPFTNWYFGTKSKEERSLLKTIIHDTPPAFLKWAIHEIINWKNKIIPLNTFHIHGTQDKIFPISKIKPHFTVKKGGHFMVYSNADTVSKIIIELVTKR